LPAIEGETSVVSSPERLPVASKNLGKSRTIAVAVVTSTAGGCAGPFASLLVFALEPPQEVARNKRPDKASARENSCTTRTGNLGENI